MDEIELLRESVRIVKNKRPFHIDAWVVLPDHLHCIWTLPKGDADFSGRWRDIKTRFSKGLPLTEHRTQVRKKRKERGNWQRRFWEHAVRDDTDYAHHMDYLHYNSVKHGYVDRVVDWPYSTFHRYVENRIYRKDWAGDQNQELNINEP